MDNKLYSLLERLAEEQGVDFENIDGDMSQIDYKSLGEDMEEFIGDIVDYFEKARFSHSVAEIYVYYNNDNYEESLEIEMCDMFGQCVGMKSVPAEDVLKFFELEIEEER